MVLLCSLKSLCLSPLLMRCHASFWNRCVLWISYGILYICCCIHRCAGACLGVVLWLHQPQICIVRVMWLFRPPSINQYCNCRYSLYSLFSNANLLSSYPASSIHSSSCCLHQSPITLSAAMKLVRDMVGTPRKAIVSLCPPPVAICPHTAAMLHSHGLLPLGYVTLVPALKLCCSHCISYCMMIEASPCWLSPSIVTVPSSRADWGHDMMCWVIVWTNLPS